eukprot:SAG31_NODE_6280_length_2089_cov_1.747236_2_plen_117_part_00
MGLIENYGTNRESVALQFTGCQTMNACASGDYIAFLCPALHGYIAFLCPALDRGKQYNRVHRLPDNERAARFRCREKTLQRLLLRRPPTFELLCCATHLLRQMTSSGASCPRPPRR